MSRGARKGVVRPYPKGPEQHKHIGERMVASIDELIEAWRPKNYTKAPPEERRFELKKKISVHELYTKLANRSIHCNVSEREDHFVCTWIANGAGASEAMRADAERLKDRERKSNHRETGLLETNQERKEREEDEAFVRDFDEHPSKRFQWIKQMAEEQNLMTVYVIELGQSVRASQSERAYPSGAFPELDVHDDDSQCFYIGVTDQTIEDRFHAGRYNHMWNTEGKPRIGVVRKHRRIADGPPFADSLNSMEELTELYGWENPGSEGRVCSFQLEHYVAWALYRCGHRTWGPKKDELDAPLKNRSWLGRRPFY